MKIRVTAQDIQGTRVHIAENPITRALRRATGQTWVVFGGTTAYLRSQPYRVIALPFEVFQHWQSHHVTGAWQPFDFEIEFEMQRQIASRRNDRRRRSRRVAPRGGWDRRRQERRDTDRRQGDRRNLPLTTRLAARKREAMELEALEVTGRKAKSGDTFRDPSSMR